MNKERFKNPLKIPSPSQELSDYISTIRLGNNKDVPAYGQGQNGIFDCYGKNEQGDELSRFRIPWGHNQQFEKSYRIKRTADGEFIVTDEGFFPYVSPHEG